MKLNYVLTGEGSSLVLLHGLFGDLTNLGMLARKLSAQYQVIQVDLRNHGRSMHSNAMSYALMAQDIKQLLDDLAIDSASIVGHSMGGKVAMALTAAMSDRINKLIVLDMAPVAYNKREHDCVFAALHAVRHEGITDRRTAATVMANYLTSNDVIQFLLKSFHQGQWAFNIPALYQHYPDILAWHPLPAWGKATLFIKGECSSYIIPEYWRAIQTQFPLATLHTIAGAGHWLHGEQPEATLSAIYSFLS